MPLAWGCSGCVCVLLPGVGRILLRLVKSPPCGLYVATGSMRECIGSCTCVGMYMWVSELVWVGSLSL